jgi:hypothetical protein
MMMKRTLIAAALALPLTAMADVYQIDSGISSAYAPVLQYGPMRKFDTQTQVFAVVPVDLPPSAVVIDSGQVAVAPTTIVSEPVAVVTEPRTETTGAVALAPVPETMTPTESVIVPQVTEDEATGLTPEAGVEPLSSADENELVKTSG